MDIKELEKIAKEYRILYNTRKCTREEAVEKITPYITAINNKSKELSKKYGLKSKNVSFSGFVR